MQVEKNSPFLPHAYVYAFLIVPLRMLPICEYWSSTAVQYLAGGNWASGLNMPPIISRTDASAAGVPHEIARIQARASQRRSLQYAVLTANGKKADTANGKIIRLTNAWRKHELTFGGRRKFLEPPAAAAAAKLK